MMSKQQQKIDSLEQELKEILTSYSSEKHRHTRTLDQELEVWKERVDV